MTSWRWSRQSFRRWPWQRPWQRPRPRVVAWPLTVVSLFLVGNLDRYYGMVTPTTSGPVLLGSALLAVAALLLWPLLGARGLPLAAGGTAVLSEALTNIRKHARDFTEVEVSLVRSGPRVTVSVSDDGRPRGAGHQTLQTPGGGFGLKGLTERVGMVGGRVQAGPVPAGGWHVEAPLPVQGPLNTGVRSAA